MLTRDMLVLTIPWIEKVIRPVIVYFALVLLLRVFGKRELAQLNPFDLVVLLCLANTLQNAIIGDDNTVVGGLIGASSLLLVNWGTVRFLMRHRRLDQLLEGKPTVLIKQGRVIKQALAREMMTVAELAVVAHRQGFRGLDQIEQIVLEPGGTFAITAKEGTRIEPSDLMERMEAIHKQLDDLRRDLKL
jgi:uncharacterized membrane protein YcaP (DUF421 family)